MADSKNFKSKSGRTTVSVEVGDEGELLIVAERDGHGLWREEIGREERPPDFSK